MADAVSQGSTLSGRSRRRRRTIPTRPRGGDEVAAASNIKISDADPDFPGYAGRFYGEIILATAAPRLDSSSAMGIVTMAEIKGPAIATETFRVEGHCCAIRIPALMDLGSAGVQFELSPEIRAELVEAGIHPVEGAKEPPPEDEPPKTQPVPR